MKTFILLFALLLIVSLNFDSYPQRKKKVLNEKPKRERSLDIKKRDRQGRPTDGGRINRIKKRKPVQQKIIKYTPHPTPDKYPPEIICRPPDYVIQRPDPTIYIEDLFKYDNVIYGSTIKGKGIIALEKNKFFEAIRLLNFAIKDNPKDFEIYLLLAVAQIGAEFFYEAIDNLDYYLLVFDEDAEGYYFRGLAKFRAGNKDDAFIDFSNTVKYGEPETKYVVKALKYLKRY